MDQAPQPTLVVMLEDIASRRAPVEVCELQRMMLGVQLGAGAPAGMEDRVKGLSRGWIFFFPFLF